jgi:acyl-CoA thioester hydrolase
MEKYIESVNIRWADIDANFHVRHSVYYDWGASVRMHFLERLGLTTALMQENNFGPILFREECKFRREIRFGDPVTIQVGLLSATKSFSRWTIRHHIMKNPDTLAAIITIDGAWMDTIKRKLCAPPTLAVDVFSKMPLDEEFTWLD